MLTAIERGTRGSFENLGRVYQITRRQIPEDRNPEVELWTYRF